MYKFFIIFLSFLVVSLQASQVKKYTNNKSISESEKYNLRANRRLGIGLYGSSSVGTNIVEYNLTPYIALGFGLGVREGYWLTPIDKVKLSSRYSILPGPFSPCGVLGYVLEGLIGKSDLSGSSANYPYIGIGMQYMMGQGLVVAIEADYFKRNHKTMLKPGMAVYWFF